MNAGWLSELAAVLRPLDRPPASPGWNHTEIITLIGDAPKRQAAVLIALRDLDEPRMIFTVRNECLNVHAGQVSFPGGGCDATDADRVATAVRESQEEIGMEPHWVTPLGFLDCYETISGYCITPVVAQIDPAARFVPEPGEVSEVFEVPLDFLLDPAYRHWQTIEFRGLRREMMEFRYGDHRIWGATAQMLRNLLERMGYA